MSASSRQRERRRSFRVDTPGVKALCCFHDAPDTYAVMDISLGGARVSTGSTVSEGSPAYVAIFADGQRVVRTAARVVHRDLENGTMGLIFEGLSHQDEEIIDDLVTENFLIRRFMGRAFV
jgi:c-di-GMP-binding flagellar brake protein YcgR